MSRFRAYKMDTAGSSFSYWDGQTFTLLEGRFNKSNMISICEELKICGRQQVDTLHITSWDNDHCNSSELEQLFYYLAPSKIELPKYSPQTDTSIQAYRLIVSYLQKSNSILFPCTAVTMDRQSVSSLPKAVAWDKADVVYNYTFEDNYNCNNNSTIKLFRSSSLSVLSLGDVEAEGIANWLTNDWIIRSEVDILILAHHGADNGFTTAELISKINPQIAICSSNYDNQFDHPRPEIRSILNSANVPLMTTKTGDVIIQTKNSLSGQFTAFNLGANSTNILTFHSFTPKKILKQQREQASNMRLVNQLMLGGKLSNSLLGNY
jgi:competence protein ComEC